MTEQQIRDSLPVPPFKYKYEVIQQSPLVWKVNLVHPNVYSHYDGHRRTVWGYVKSNMVYPPGKGDRPAKTPVCDLSDISDDLSWTTIIPKCRSLLHLT